MKTLLAPLSTIEQVLFRVYNLTLRERLLTVELQFVINEVILLKDYKTLSHQLHMPTLPSMVIFK